MKLNVVFIVAALINLIITREYYSLVHVKSSMQAKIHVKRRNNYRMHYR